MKHPLKQMVWYPTMKFTRSEIVFRFYYFWYQYVPAFFADIVLSLMKSKYRLVKIYSKIFFHMKLTSYFGQRTWKFHDTNKSELIKIMSNEDLQTFPFDYTFEEGAQAYPDSIIGFSKYFFKQTEKDNELAHKKLQILSAVHYTLLTMFYSCIAYAFFSFLENGMTLNFLKHY